MADSLIIHIDGDDSGYRKALENIEKTTKSAMSAMGDSTEKATDAIDDLGDKAEDAAKETDDLGESSDKAGKKTKELGEKSKKSKIQIEDLGKKSDKATENLDKMKDGAKTAAIAVVGLATAVGTVALKSMQDYQKASNSFRSQTGMAEDEARDFEKAMSDIYAGNYGESFEDIADSMAAVVQSSKNIDPTNVQKLTTNALTLRDTFGFEIPETMRAANMLIDQFGVTGEEAFNLIAQGAQNGLNKNDDLLDSINEYSVHYKQMGMGAEEMFNSLKNGAQKGTFSVDKLGDAMKEFGIRSKDNSDSTKKAFQQIGLNADKMTKKFAKGGKEGKEAFNDVTDALFKMDDKVAQNEAGVALFGTMWEDLGEDGVRALSDLNGEFDKTKSTMSDITQIKYDTPLEAIQGAGRTIQTSVIAPLSQVLMPTINDITAKITSWAKGFKKDAENGTLEQKINGTVGALKIAVPLVATGVAAYKSYQIATMAATAAQALFNGTILLNPIGLIAAGAVTAIAAVAGIAAAVGNARDEYFQFGEEIEKAGEKYEEAKEKADLTEDYAAKWRDMKNAIAEGKVPAEEMGAAQQTIKDYEQWFIDHYGDYISAEEQKNGIRDETIEKLEKQQDTLAEIERLELEAELRKVKPDLKKHAEDIKNAEATIKSLEEQKQHATDTRVALLNVKKEYEQLVEAGARTEEINKFLEDTEKSFYELSGTAEGTFQKLTTANFENRITKALSNTQLQVKDAESGLTEYNDVIDDTTLSLQTYQAQSKSLIDTALGSTYQEWSTKIDLVKDAQDKLSKGINLSEEDIQKLTDKFPELKEQEITPQTLSEKFKDLTTDLEKAAKQADLLGTNLNGIPKNIDVGVTMKVFGNNGLSMNGYAKGTDYAKKGLSVVNERGMELIESKNGSFRYVDSDTAALTYLEHGDRVYTAQQTKRMLRGGVVGIPGFADGLNNRGSIGVSSSILIDVKSRGADIGKMIAEGIAVGIDDGKSDIEKGMEEINKACAKSEFERKLSLVETAKDIEEIEKEHIEGLLDSEKHYMAESRRLEIEKEQSTMTAEERRKKRAENEQKAYIDKLKETAETERKIMELHRKELESIRQKCVDNLKEMAEAAFDDIDELESAVNTMSDKFKSYGSLYYSYDLPEITINGVTQTPTVTKLSDLDEQTETMQKYADNLEAIKSRANVPKEFFKTIGEMSIDEGLTFTNTLLAASDSEFDKYIESWQRKQDEAERIAKAVYADDYEKARKMIEDKFGPEAADRFFQIGGKSAQEFGEGFVEEFRNVLKKIWEKAGEQLAGFAPHLAITVEAENAKAAMTSNVYNSTATYNLLPSPGESTRGQLAEVKAAEWLNRARNRKG